MWRQEKNLEIPQRHRILANWIQFVQWAPNLRPAFENRSYWTVADRFTLIRDHKTPRIRALGNFFEGHRVPQVRVQVPARPFSGKEVTDLDGYWQNFVSAAFCVITAGLLVLESANICIKKIYVFVK